MARAALPLVPHPSSPPSPLREIRVSVERTARGLHAQYRIEGDLDRIRIPPPSEPRRVDGLWRHTCCELFMAREREDAYLELNFSPSGEWAAYGFHSYRNAAALPELLPQIRVKRENPVLELDAEAPLDASGKLRIGLSAVIEDAEGNLSYWALAHAAGKPDFHHRDAFALELA